MLSALESHMSEEFSIHVYLNVLLFLCAASQPSYAYHIAGGERKENGKLFEILDLIKKVCMTVASNDELYGGDDHFQEEIVSLGLVVIERILSILKGLGEKNVATIAYKTELIV